MMDDFLPDNVYVRHWILAFFGVAIVFVFYNALVIPITVNFTLPLQNEILNFFSLLVGTLTNAFFTMVAIALLLNLIVYYSTDMDKTKEFLAFWVLITITILVMLIVASILETLLPGFFYRVSVTQFLGIQDRVSINIPLSFATAFFVVGGIVFFLKWLEER